LDASAILTCSTNVFDSGAARVALDADLLVTAITRAQERMVQDPLGERTFTLSHARVAGRVDLANLFRDRQNALIGLFFNDCVFEDEIDLTGSALLGLRFQKCGLRIVTGESCKVFGEVQFDQVFSSEAEGARTGMEARDTWYGTGRGPLSAAFDPDGDDKGDDEVAPRIEGVSRQGLCQINFRNAELDQSFELRRSLVCGPPPRGHIDSSNTILVYALALGGAQVGRNVSIYEGSAVLGGLSVARTRIGGNLFLASSRLVAGESAALDGQQARIEGFVGLRGVRTRAGTTMPFEAKGLVNFLNANLQSTLDLSDAELVAEPRDGLVALQLSQARIGDVRAISPDRMTDIRGQIQALDCEIEHSMHLESLLVRPRRLANLDGSNSQPGETVLANFTGCQVGGSVYLMGEWRGVVRMAESRVGNSINLGFNTGLKLISPPKAANALMLDSTTAGIGLEIGLIEVDSEDSWLAMRKILGAPGKIDCRVTPLSFVKDGELWEFSVTFRGRRHFGEALRVGRHVQLLEGAGPAFIKAFRRRDLTFESDEQKKDYLRLFCGTLMGDAGHFRIVEPGDWSCDRLPAYCRASVEPLRLMTDDELAQAGKAGLSFGAHATIWYADKLFRAKLAVHGSNHVVEMLSDDELHSDLPTMTWPAKPLFFVEDGVPVYGENWPRAPILHAEPRFETMPRRMKRCIAKARGVTEDTFRMRPTVGLRNCHFGKLTDDHGNRWPKSIRLDLSGLTYDAVEMPDPRNKVVKRKAARHKMGETWRKNPGVFWFVWMLIIGSVGLLLLLIAEEVATAVEARNYGLFAIWAGLFLLLGLGARARRHMNPLRDAARSWRKRRRWLRLQFYDYVPTRDEFNPQPMEQLAQVMRHQGDEEGFRRISRLKSRWQNRTQTFVLLRPFIWVFGVAFGYGFSVYRSLVTFVGLVVLGVWATHLALEREILVLNASPDAAFVVPEGRALPNQPCRDEILPVLFALDKFVPLIELGQERLCRVRSEMAVGAGVPFWSPRVVDTPRFWQVAGSIYKLLGWIVSSILVLTFSKTLRRSTGE